MEERKDYWSYPFSPSGFYIWVGVALLSLAAWIPVLSDGFSDPSIAAPFCGFVASLGLGALVTGGVARGILLARSDERRESTAKN